MINKIPIPFEIRFLLCITGFLISVHANAQQSRVSGTVKDETDEPLIGVTVSLKGKANVGTTTDTKGNFTIQAAPDDSLVFSYVGYQTKTIKVGDNAYRNVVLTADVASLNQVVVIGYGTQKESNLTTAVDQVSKEMLVNRPVKSVTEALQGTTAGLNVSLVNGAPQQDYDLNIRGFTGFNVKGSPLVLVDGVERTLSDIDPNNVESISVLKDAAASAIYGSRAPFGVILVTTKSGKKDHPFSVSYDANFSFGTPLGLPGMLDSWVFADRFNAFYRNTLQAPQFSEEAIQRMKDYGAGKIDSNNIVQDGGWGRHWASNDNIDWFRKTTRNVIPSQRHHLSLSGGGQKTTYYAGLGYNQSVGIFAGAGDHKDRYNALLKVNSDVKEWLSFNFSMDYVYTEESGPAFSTDGRDYDVIFNWISRTWPNWPAFQPNGTPDFISIYNQLTGRAGMVNLSRNVLNASGGFKITPLRGWEINGIYNIELSNQRYQRTAFPQNGLGPDGQIIYSARAPRISELERQMNDNRYRTINLYSSYRTNLGKNNFEILAGYQQEYNLFNSLEGLRQSLYSQSVLSLDLATGQKELSDQLYHWGTEGYFGRFSYNYDGKYLFQFNGRYDAASKYPKDTRWAFFPSFSVGWNIAEESFWPIPFVNSFKIRASYASLGDQGSGNNYYLFAAPMGTAVGGKDVILGDEKAPMVFAPSLISNDITWAKPRTIDFGLDMSALDGRINLHYDWYQRTVYDQIGPAEELPTVLGTAPPKTNNAITETCGWEFTVRWNDNLLIGKGINYFVKLNISDYIGYVVSYQKNITGNRDSWSVGQEFGKNYFYQSAGIAQDVETIEGSVIQGDSWYYPGDLILKDINGDGKIDGGEGNTWASLGDLTSDGFNYPRYTYGVTIGADWNGFNFSLLLEGVGAWKIYSNSPWLFGATTQWNGGWFKEHDELGYWTPDNPDAFYFRKAFNSKNTGRANDQYAVNLANLRIRNLRIGYSLPENIIKKVNLQRANIYISTENLGFIFYKSWIKYDPAIISSYDGQGYPPQRVVSLGINLTL